MIEDEPPFSPGITLLLAAAGIILLLAGCSANHPYNGPTISTVGVTGTYSDGEGDTLGGGINFGLAYPTPTPTPKSAVDRSK